MDHVTAIAAAITAVVAILGFGAVIWQVRLDHRRRRGQATLETWIATRERRLRLRTAVLDMDRSPHELSAELETRRALNEWLSDVEAFSLGVNTGIFDFDITDRVAGSFFVRLWNWAGGWIKERQTAASPTVYRELELLAKRIVEKRRADGTMPISGFHEREDPLERVPDVDD